MRRLLIVRHAKSSWKHPELEDHDRPLNKRGMRDKVTMSRYLAEHGEVLDGLFSSTARRALELAHSMADQLDVSLIQNRGLYTFSAGRLLTEIGRLSPEYSKVAVVGHNPAVTELAEKLSGERLHNVPTSGVVALNCDCSSWEELDPLICKMDYFISPKRLP